VQVSVNPVEVAATRWVDLQQLQQEMMEQPEAFTEWFRDEATLVGLFEGRVVPLAASCS
jgi:isopentenyldiphosphate isomerase